MAYQPKSYKKFVATAATATLVASAIAPAVSAASFSDVNDRYKEAVSYLASKGITQGYPNGKFGTNDNIKRQDAAVMVARALGAKADGNYPNAGFTDVRSDAQWAVNYLADKKIVSGKAAGKFGANDFMTRGEMAKVIANAYEFVGDPTNAFPFTDVSDTFKEYVDALQEAGVAQGLTATKFGTGENVTRGQFALFVHRAETYVPANPAVVSVSAVNAKELQITFNQAIDEASVIEDDGTLVDGVFKVDTLAADGLKGSLSTDGKVLTVTAGASVTTGVPVSTWEGTHAIELLADKAESLTGKKVPHFTKAFSFADTTRASITGVDFVNKYSYKVKFSEPVSTTGTVTAKLADGTSVTLDSSTLAADGKSVTVVFNNATPQNKEITISFPTLTDFAGNVSVPLTAKATISDADQTKPAVTSITATSLTSVKVKFSEVITLEDASKILYNGTNAGVSAAVDSNDKTVLNVTVPSTTTSAVIALDAGAVKDLNTNTNAPFTQTVSFTADKVAPTVVSQQVVRDAGVNKLVLKMSENVTKSGTAPALTFKYTDEFGVLKSVNVPATNVVVDSNDATKVTVTLNDGTNPLKAEVNYTVDVPTGYFVDGFGNNSAATTLSFLNSASDAVTKLKLIATNPIVTTDVDGDANVATRANTGAFLDVQFADAVDAASAKVASNYVVEGAEVSKVELVYNNPTTGNANGAKAVVRVYIKDNTVEETGYYNVTVRGVKGYSSAVSVMNEDTRNLQIVENTRPTVAAAVVKSLGSNSVITVTFSEAIATGASDTNDFDLYVDGVKTTATVTAGTAAKSIDFTVDTDLSGDLAAGKNVKLVAKSTLDLLDANNNKADVKEVIVK